MNTQQLFQEYTSLFERGASSDEITGFISLLPVCKVRPFCVEIFRSKNELTIHMLKELFSHKEVGLLLSPYYKRYYKLTREFIADEQYDSFNQDYRSLLQYTGRQCDLSLVQSSPGNITDILIGILKSKCSLEKRKETVCSLLTGMGSCVDEEYIIQEGNINFQDTDTADIWNYIQLYIA
jgi:hypothetical protein